MSFVNDGESKRLILFPIEISCDDVVGDEGYRNELLFASVFQGVKELLDSGFLGESEPT